MEEKVVGLKTVTAYNKQQDTIAEFEKISDQLTQTGIKAEIIGGATGPVMNCINNIGFVIIAAFGGYFSYKGMISLGVISAFIIYAKQFSRPINEMAQLYAQIQTAFAGAERVFEIMDQPNEDKSGSEKMPTIGNISFEHVDFSYLPGKQVLRDFTLDVKTGQKVALVGATGSGKTTVVNLLMRFYDIDAGKIFLDGVDIQKIPREELRKEVAIVLQDTLLFADTVRNNLLFANEQATEEELERAVIIGNCKKVIQHLPYGYETKLSENGANLSQGQRQLLAIGRAALASPTILILDEATSSVDTRTEKHIQDAMVKLMEGRTSLIIAHRLSTIMDADLIAVMDQGHIVELGNHEQLLRKHGRYYELYMTQFSGQSI